VFQSYFSNKLNNILSNGLNNIKTLSNALFGEEVERHWTLCCYYWHHFRRWPTTACGTPPWVCQIYQQVGNRSPKPGRSWRRWGRVAACHSPSPSAGGCMGWRPGRDGRSATSNPSSVTTTQAAQTIPVGGHQTHVDQGVQRRIQR
jgi:hypothetical protein